MPRGQGTRRARRVRVRQAGRYTERGLEASCETGRWVIKESVVSGTKRETGPRGDEWLLWMPDERTKMVKKQSEESCLW